MVWKAAHAFTEVKFEEELAKINDINPEAVEWLRNTNPIFWANAFFPGKRYNHLTSNIAESLNSWILAAREKPVMQMMENIRQQLMKWFVERRSEAAEPGLYVKKVAEQLSANKVKARSYHGSPSTVPTIWEIASENSNHIVNLNDKTCTCFKWQFSGIPCAHAINAVMGRLEDLHLYVDKYFTKESIRLSYAGDILPIPDKSQWFDEVVEVSSEEDILPPNTRRPPGRPKKKRFRAEDLGKEKRRFTCSRCNGVGHSRKTCKVPI